MDFKIITVSNSAYKAFSSRYLVENHGISNNITEAEEKELLLPLFTETVTASRELSGVPFSDASLGQELTASGLVHDVSALLCVLRRAVELFLDDYDYSLPKLFTALSAKPAILYQVTLLAVAEFYKGYRVEPSHYGGVIVSLKEEASERMKKEEEDARIRAIIDDWKKAEEAYVESLDLNASRLYYVNKLDGFLPDCLREAYENARPYLKG